MKVKYVVGGFGIWVDSESTQGGFGIPNPTGSIQDTGIPNPPIMSIPDLASPALWIDLASFIANSVSIT